jgi:riboflavin kinase/FMN adenylyltransferase
MKEQIKKIKSTSSKTAVALGFFDGIHLGHKAVINAMLKCARENSLTSALYTFEKSPSALFGKDTPFLATNDERLEILQDMGVKVVFQDDFLNIKDLTPEEFVSEVLVKRFCAHSVFCGFNYHFGKGGTADSEKLKEICGKYKINVQVIPPVIVEGEPVSSTRIRNLLKEGRVQEANSLLSHPFGYTSVIKEGNHIGRLMETPTINQDLPENIILPKFGVYTSRVTIGGNVYVGVTNIGVKPTIGEYTPLSETWLPEYKGKSLYGEKIDVRLLCFHRPEMKFDSFEELQTAIKNDGKLAVENFKRFL